MSIQKTVDKLHDSCNINETIRPNFNMMIKEFFRLTEITSVKSNIGSIYYILGYFIPDLHKYDNFHHFYIVKKTHIKHICGQIPLILHYEKYHSLIDQLILKYGFNICLASLHRKGKFANIRITIDEFTCNVCNRKVDSKIVASTLKGATNGRSYKKKNSKKRRV